VKIFVKFMSEITIKITIKESEYSEWSSFENGVEAVKSELLKDFKDCCKKLGIEGEIEVI
jgi:hypothetical protein